MRQLARELLDDVGRPDSDLEDVQDKSYQIIRQVTIEEVVRKPSYSWVHFTGLEDNYGRTSNLRPLLDKG